MIAVVLVAGYATRLRPLTLDTPKPLLPVAGRSILDRILDSILPIPGLSRIVLVSNDLFFKRFERWRDGRDTVLPIQLINDGSRDNDHRVGALGDLALAAPWIEEGTPVLVVAGDNLFPFEPADFAAWSAARGTDCITVHRQTAVERLRRTGVAELDERDRVVGFEEKPEHPKSEWAVPPLYYFLDATVRDELPRFLAEGHDGDAPGSFIPWLLAHRPIHAYRFEGERYDIGTIESYREVERVFSLVSPTLGRRGDTKPDGTGRYDADPSTQE